MHTSPELMLLALLWCQVAAQLQALLQEKAKLASENARLAHENTSLQVHMCHYVAR